MKYDRYVDYAYRQMIRAEAELAMTEPLVFPAWWERIASAEASAARLDYMIRVRHARQQQERQMQDGD